MDEENGWVLSLSFFSVCEHKRLCIRLQTSKGLIYKHLVFDSNDMYFPFDTTNQMDRTTKANCNPVKYN